MIEIVRSLRRGDETAAAALYWRAFGRKLGWPLGPEQRGIEFLATHLRHDRAICAYIDDELIGLAGYKHQKRALTGGQACDWPAHSSPADHPRAGESYPVDPKTCRLNFLFPIRLNCARAGWCRNTHGLRQRHLAGDRRCGRFAGVHTRR